MADFDPFAEATPEEQAAAEEAKKAAEAKKAEKPKAVGKSTIAIAIKPADSDIELSVIEEAVRKIQHEGLLWGISRTEPIGFGLNKLIMGGVITDDVGLDDLCEEIEALEDLVQSTEVLAFQKI